VRFRWPLQRSRAIDQEVLVTTPNDILTDLDGLVDKTGHEEASLREYLLNLSHRLSGVCSRADVRCQGETIRLEACNDDEWVFGYMFCNADGLSIASAFSGDGLALAPGEDISYELTSVQKCPLSWLRVICRRDVIEVFLSKVQDEILKRTDELRSQVTELETLALPPAQSAAVDFRQVAEQLGFGRIAGDWRAAQVKTSTDPETAVRAACTLLESVCKHILDDKREPYAADADLGVLFRSTRRILKLHADAGTDEILQRIIKGLNGAVQGIGMLRNRISDAHGKGSSRETVLPAEAKLAVNAAGTVAMFLLERWKSAKEKA